MFAKITRGGRAGGLMAYLQGPGRSNEHTRPHLVAGDALLMAWHGHEELTRTEALAIAKHVDRPWRAHGTPVTVRRPLAITTGESTSKDGGGVTLAEKERAPGVAEERDGHVWHCSLSLRAEEGELDDTRWQEIAETFVEKMGFTDHVAAGSRDGGAAPCRWVAVHHGLSGQGNDHVHLMVNLVREDGSKADTFRDFARARDACRELEAEFDLMALHPDDYQLARSAARAQWEAGRRAEPAGQLDTAAVGEGDVPRMPWDDLDEATHEDLTALQFDTRQTFERARAAHTGETPASVVDTKQAWFNHAEREADARRTARGVFEQSRRDGSEHRTWSTLDTVERTRLVEQAKLARQPRFDLARRVRACAGAAEDEARFVTLLRHDGLIVRGRRGDTPGAVVGYSVAVRPQAGEQPVWYGGGTLGRDLSLPSLRARWSTNETTPAAAAEWENARRRRPPSPLPDERIDPNHEAARWQAAAANLSQLRQHLRTLPLEDQQQWADAAHQTAAVLAAWSRRTEPTPGPLAKTSDAIAHAAGRRASLSRGPLRVRGVSITGTTLLLMSASRPGPAGSVALIREIANLSKAIHDMHHAAQAARTARQVETAVRRHLTQVATRVEHAHAGGSSFLAGKEPALGYDHHNRLSLPGRDEGPRR